MIIRIPYLGFCLLLVLALTACTTAKLEARLEANPQCKEVINPKTGSLMPCPGTDRAFYRAAGLESPKPSAPNSAQTESTPNSVASTVSTAAASIKNGQPTVSQPVSNPRDGASLKTDCKPTIHNKTGGLIPCLPPD